MQTGKRGMGAHKHGISGYAGPTPGAKIQRAREVNRLAEAERARRPSRPVFGSVAEAMRSRRKRAGPDK